MTFERVEKGQQGRQGRRRRAFQRRLDGKVKVGEERGENRRCLCVGAEYDGQPEGSLIHCIEEVFERGG
jgi:hypothetical protein